jgi:chromosome partitioning protein
MTYTIALLNQKGGVGKTTLAVNLAGGLCRRGGRVLLVDADVQGSALDWAAAREGEPLFSVVGLPKPTLHKELPALGASYDAVVIDGPPRVNDVARSAILAADLVLIPVQPSPYDVWAAAEIVELLRESSVYKPDQTAAFVVNRLIANTAIGRDVQEALAEYRLPLLASVLCQRVAFAESAAQGKTVFETQPDGAACREAESLTDEVLGMAR